MIALILVVAVGCTGRPAPRQLDIPNQPDFKGPVAAFRETQYAGTAENGLLSHDFHFANVGNQPLEFVKVIPNCSCLTVDYPREPIPAHGESAITVEMKPRHNRQVASVALETNEPVRNEVILSLTASAGIPPALTFIPFSMRLTTATGRPINARATLRLELQQDSSLSPGAARSSLEALRKVSFTATDERLSVELDPGRSVEKEILNWGEVRKCDLDPWQMIRTSDVKTCLFCPVTVRVKPFAEQGYYLLSASASAGQADQARSGLLLVGVLVRNDDSAK